MVFFALMDILLLILFVSVSNVHIRGLQVKKYNVMQQLKINIYFNFASFTCKTKQLNNSYKYKHDSKSKPEQYNVMQQLKINIYYTTSLIKTPI